MLDGRCSTVAKIMYSVGFTFLTPILGELEPGAPLGRDNGDQVRIRPATGPRAFGDADQAKALSLSQGVLDHRSAYAGNCGDSVEGQLAAAFARYLAGNHREGRHLALGEVASETGRDDTGRGVLTSAGYRLAPVGRDATANCCPELTAVDR